MMRQRFAVLSLVLLSGCGATNAPRSPARAPATASVRPAPPRSTAPASPAALAVPTVPAAARQKSPAGAVAYGSYYVRVLDYTYRTLDVGPLRTASYSRCNVCQGTADDVARFKRPGYKFVGGQIRLWSTYLVPRMVTNMGSNEIVSTRVSIAALTVTDPAGHRDPYSGPAYPRAAIAMLLGWSGTQWTVLNFTVTEKAW